MPKVPTSWKPGQSGNPNGRPKKERALTAILEKAGNKTTFDSVTNKRVARKQIIARALWELSTEGKTTLPTGETLTLSPEDWVGVVKWIYNHIDGPAKSELDLNGEITITVNYAGDDDETTIQAD